MTGKLILPGAVEAALQQQESIDDAKKRLPDLADPAVNPHGLKAEELQAYQPHHWPLVLKHGRRKFGLACVVLAANGALNHIGQIGRRHNCQRSLQAPMEALQGVFASLFHEISEIYKWTPEEIKAVQGELTRAEIKDGTPTLVGPSGAPLH